jgi:polyphosphate kinase 2
MKKDQAARKDKKDTASVNGGQQAAATPDIAPQDAKGQNTMTDDKKKNKKSKKNKKKHRDAALAAEAAAAATGGPPEKAAPSKEKPSKEKLTGKAYAAEMARLHAELVTLQEWVKYKGLKVCVLFEGRDGAGKGGVIKAITERVSPRVFRTIALPAPSDREKSQMYIQRYLPHLPAAGEVIIFDRSWYNRAGVERVMGFSSEDAVQKFLREAPLVEKAIVDSGVILLKYWLEVSEAEQTRRLSSRIDDKRKIWKLTGMDLKSYSRWYDYSRARDEMFKATDTGFAPWYVVRSDDKKRARLNLISHLLGQIPYQKAPREKVKLPKRQKPGDYKEPDYQYKFVPEKF